MRFETHINISRLHFPVTRLGPGRRVGVWMQGCSIRCAGCISADTWRPDLGKTSIEAVVAQIESWSSEAEGFTISGGEPFDQPDALVALLKEIRKRSSADILVFSGYALEVISDALQLARGLIDALITDPFDLSVPQTLALRGSDNQRLHLLTELGRTKFSSFERARNRSDQGLDVMADDDGTFWFAGIPSHDDFEALKELLRADGHRFLSSDAKVQTGKTLP